MNFKFSKNLIIKTIVSMIIILISPSLNFSQTDNWTQKTDIGGFARKTGVGFSIGSKGYIGTGNESGIGNGNSFWEYDPSTETWSQKADFGGGSRGSAVGFSIGSKGYIGTGVDINGQFKKDFWEYNPTTNMWTQKADFGGGARIQAVSFAIGSKGYLGTGTGTTLYYFDDLYINTHNDFWEYDPDLDIWTQKADFGGPPRNGAVGFSIGEKGYIGTGNPSGGAPLFGAWARDFWEYDPITNNWQRKSDIGGQCDQIGHMLSVAFSIGNKGYLGTGGAAFHLATFGVSKEFLEYDPILDLWERKTDFAGLPRTEAVGFAIGNKGYIGTGESSFGLTKDFWEYTPGQGLNTFYRDADNDNYGDPINYIQNSSLPSGYVTNCNDCNDTNNEVYLGAIEICNGIDDDCDGLIDEPRVLYQDFDGDGFGNLDSSFQSCADSVGYVSDSTDCDDTNSDIHPNAIEICNGKDDDCDGLIDETQRYFYLDADNDGFGTNSTSIFACESPEGYVSNNFDCDDSNPTISPQTQEILNGLDDNCNGDIDEGLCDLSVSAGPDEHLYFGYTQEQCTSITALVTGGTAPFIFEWALNRPLLSDVLNAEGDETMTGQNSSAVTICLLDTAELCITVTDANGCIFTDCITIIAEDVRCFAGNSNNQKVSICHNGKTICVDQNSFDEHLSHGDFAGTCIANLANLGRLSPIEKLNSSISFDVFPNPNSGNFIISLNLPDMNDNSHIQIVNTEGKTIRKIKHVDQNILKINIENPGIYFIQVISANRILTKKFVVF